MGLSVLREYYPAAPRLVRDIAWVIKRTKDALVRRNCIEKDFLCPKGVLVLSPVRCNGPQTMYGAVDVRKEKDILGSQARRECNVTMQNIEME